MSSSCRWANELLAIVSNGSEAEVVGGIPAPGLTMMLDGGVMSVSSIVTSDSVGFVEVIRDFGARSLALRREVKWPKGPERFGLTEQEGVARFVRAGTGRAWRSWDPLEPLIAGGTAGGPVAPWIPCVFQDSFRSLVLHLAPKAMILNAPVRLFAHA